MKYVIKRTNDKLFHFEGEFIEIKKYFLVSLGNREDMSRDQVGIYDDIISNNDCMDQLFDSINRLDSSHMNFYVESRNMSIEEAMTRAESGLDLITENERTFFIKKEELSWDEYYYMVSEPWEGTNVKVVYIEGTCYLKVTKGSSDVLDLVVTVTEAAEIEGVTPRTIRDRCARDEYECRKAQKSFIIYKRSLINEKDEKA